nr:unnamed protein product [Naegleria fowleri]
MEESVRKVCRAVENFVDQFPYYDSSECVSYDACDPNLNTKIPDFKCEKGFGMDVECNCTGEMLSLHFPVLLHAPFVKLGSDEVFECLTKRIGEIYYENRMQNEHIFRQVVGSPRGIGQLYPGIKWRTTDKEICKSGAPAFDCPNFDFRTRPWYVNAASGSKSIVFVLDVSSSMSMNHRIEIAVFAVENVIDGLTERDRVGIVFFSSSAFFCSLHGKTLLLATPENKKLLKACLEDMMPFGETNFENAFELAFDLFEAEASNSSFNLMPTCEKVILFLTDGEITDGEDPTPLIERENEKFDAKIFSFSLGSDADLEIPKRIACKNRGLWNKISDHNLLDLRTQMSSYYEYLSFRLTDQHVTWSDPFMDVTGLGEIVSVSSPCISQRGRFLGVAVSACNSSLVKNDPEYTKRKANNFKKCPDDIPEDFLIYLRSGESCDYCGNCDFQRWYFVLAWSTLSVLLVALLATLLTCLYIFIRKIIRKKKWQRLKDEVYTESLTHRPSFYKKRGKLEKIVLPLKIEDEELVVTHR